MDLGAATRELFELPPAEFTAERDKLAAEARRAGTRELAAAIKALRRPTTSAWLANLLVRQRQDLVAELVALGAAMRNAQASLAAGDMRALAAVRRRLIAALVAEAGALATERGQSLTRAGQEELEATFEAAVADEGAAGALRSGRLAATPQLYGPRPGRPGRSAQRAPGTWFCARGLDRSCSHPRAGCTRRPRDRLGRDRKARDPRGIGGRVAPSRGCCGSGRC